VLADAGSIPAVSTTEQKIRAPARKRWGPDFLFGGAGQPDSNPRSSQTDAGHFRRAACGPPEMRRALASAGLSDSPILEITARFRAASDGVPRSGVWEV